LCSGTGRAGSRDGARIPVALREYASRAQHRPVSLAWHRDLSTHGVAVRPSNSTPGGVLELGETIHDGLRREIREETGLDIEPDQLTGIYKNMARGIIALVFRCKITGGQLTTNDEVTAFRWADQDAIRDLTTEAYAVRLLDAMRTDTAPAVREHDGTRLLD